MRHLGDDPLPEGVYTDAEAAIVRYAQRLTSMEPIDDALFAQLSEHFDTRQLMELCFTVGLNQMVSRFHATFHTEVDSTTLEQLGSDPPLPLPPAPAPA